MKKHIAVFLFTLLFACTPTDDPKNQSTENSEAEPVSLSYRLHPNFWETDEQIGQTIEFFQAYQASVNELALFDVTIPYRPIRSLKQIRQTSAVMGKRIQQLKTAGIPSVGVNMLGTLNFRRPEGPAVLGFQETVEVGGQPNGLVRKACVNDTAFVAYIQEYYRINARMNPDFIWIDDDFRPSVNGCFCPLCLDKFGHKGSMEELVARLDAPDNEELRMEWTQFRMESMNAFARAIREAIDEIDSNIPVGLMTVGYDHFLYGAYNFSEWMEILDAKMCRPGHGYYHDTEPRKVLNKIMSVTRQVRDCPPSVTDIQYEMENWPYVTLEKSVSTFTNEITLAHVAGCTGVANNILYERGKVNYAEYEGFLNSIAQNKRLWAEINRFNTLPLRGFYTLDSRFIHAKRSTDDISWFEKRPGAYDIQRAVPLAEAGIPLTTYPEHAQVHILTGRIPEAYSDEELKEMLSGAVFVDGEASLVLWERGLGELIGAKQSNEGLFGTEVFTDHPFNGRFAGDGRRAQGWSGSHYLEVTDDQVEVLSDFYTMTQEYVAPCVTKFENELGGKVIVSTYYPFSYNGRAGKHHQLRQITDWLTDGKAAVQIGETVRLVPYARISEGGDRAMVAFFNTSFDNYREVPVDIRAGNIQQFYYLDGAGQKQPLPFEGKEGGASLKLPEVPAWSVFVVFGE